ncbi:unnamed protein product [Arabidopsis halleri]
MTLSYPNQTCKSTRTSLLCIVSIKNNISGKCFLRISLRRGITKS